MYQHFSKICTTECFLFVYLMVHININRIDNICCPDISSLLQLVISCLQGQSELMMLLFYQILPNQVKAMATLGHITCSTTVPLQNMHRPTGKKTHKSMQSGMLPKNQFLSSFRSKTFQFHSSSKEKKKKKRINEQVIVVQLWKLLVLSHKILGVAHEVLPAERLSQKQSTRILWKESQNSCITIVSLLVAIAI